MDAVKNTNKIINDQEHDENYDSFYLFTNENLKAICEKIKLTNKEILTVCSSSDQYLNFLLQEPQSIDLFDINKLTEYFFYFKKAAIINLDYEEFKRFLIPKKLNKKDFFSKEIYKHIKEDIPDNIQSFWNQILNTYSNKELYKSNLFVTDNKNNIKENINNNLYLYNENNYLKLKHILKKIDITKFYNIDIFSNFIKDKKTYDFIYLSNIIDYLPIIDKKEYYKKLKIIIETIASHLNEDGLIGLNYLFTYLDDYWENTNNYVKIEAKKRHQLKKKKIPHYELLSFNSGLIYKSHKEEDKDALVLYRK